jgi:hypothetical protein
MVSLISRWERCCVTKENWRNTNRGPIRRSERIARCATRHPQRA